MHSQLEALTPEELITATGGDFKGATFGALALLNASGMVTQPSNSVSKALQGPPPIVQVQSLPPRPSFIAGPKP